MPSVAYLPAAGAPLFGDDAEAHAAAEPDRVVREFTARVGDYVPIVVGERTVSAEEITAATVRHAVQVAAQRQGAPSELVVVSHPASWGSYKRHALGKALTDGGVENVQLLSEPVAAAMRIAAHEDIEPGQVVAVYDLGGRSFDAAVLRRTADGFEVLGPPTGIAELGGVDFDQAVFDHLRVGVRLPAPDPSDSELLAAMGRIRLACVEAKETLSADTAASIPVVLPAGRTRVRLTRGEFEGMIRDALASTVTCLADAIEYAGVEESDVAAILMVGGSSRIPLAAQLISERFASPLLIDRDPKATVALGAARFGAGLLAPSMVGEELAADDLAQPVGPPAALPDATAAPGAPRRSGRHSRADDEADEGVLLLASVDTAEAAESAAAAEGRHRFGSDERRGRHRRFRAALLAAGTAVVVAGASVAIAVITEPRAPVPSAIADEVPRGSTEASPPEIGGESGPAGAPESADGSDDDAASGEPGTSAPEGEDGATAAGGASAQSGSGSRSAGGGSSTGAATASTGASTSAATDASTSASAAGASTAASRLRHRLRHRQRRPPPRHRPPRPATRRRLPLRRHPVRRRAAASPAVPARPPPRTRVHPTPARRIQLPSTRRPRTRRADPDPVPDPPRLDGAIDVRRRASARGPAARGPAARGDLRDDGSTTDATDTTDTTSTSPAP